VYDGFCVVLSTIPSFWKSHDHAAGLPDEISVNCTASGAEPDLGEAVKLAYGAVCGRIEHEMVTESLLAAPAPCITAESSRHATMIQIIFRYIFVLLMRLLP
jgi:hypothetical protein